jgi:hypothetical protein
VVAALAVGARITAPLTAAAANHGATRLIVLFIVFTPVFGSPIWLDVLIVAAPRTGVVGADIHSEPGASVKNHILRCFRGPTHVATELLAHTADRCCLAVRPPAKARARARRPAARRRRGRFAARSIQQTLQQPGVNAAVLTGKQFFPQLISGPFHNGLVVVFTAAAVMMVIGAAASWVNPGRTADDSDD